MGQHVLVPVDGSVHSEKALEYALDHIPEPKITLLRVIDPVNAMVYGDDEYFDIEGFQEEVKRQYDRDEAMLEGYRETASARGFEVETILTTGKPARRILETAQTNDVDHIVLGSRGRSGIERIMFGSVAETVTRRATVPVTIVR